MEKFTFVVSVKVEVTAFDEDDAQTVVRDYFGPGPMDDALNVIKMTITK